MVSLRSGSCIGADAAPDQFAEVQSAGPKPRRGSAAPSNTLTELPKSKKEPKPRMARTASRLGTKLDFLQSKAVHTRSGQPIPDISLSTELPDLEPALQPEATAVTRVGTNRVRGSNGELAEGFSTSAVGFAEPLLSAKKDGDVAVSTGEATVTDGDEESAGASGMSSGYSDSQASREPSGQAMPASSSLGHANASASDASSRESEDSDVSEDEVEDFTGLAASMWSALQKQRRPQSQTGRSSTEEAKRSGTDRSSVNQDTGKKDVAWQPQALQVKPLASKELIQRQEPARKETSASKQLMAGSRDRKAESKAKKASQPRPWHELPSTVMTDEMKRDLRLLRLRGAMDPKRFYKRADKGKFPTKFAVGTIVEGAADFYSGRLTNKERKQTITQELLADQELQHSRKKRFTALQEENSRWSHKKHKGSGERIKKRHKRAKH